MKIAKIFAAAAAALFLLMQLYQPDRENPPVDRSQTLQAQLQVPPDIDSLFMRGCKDCHSNESDWPFYSYIAPVSWLVSYDVYEGRKHFNMSEWGSYKESKKVQKLSGIYQAVSEKTMPLPKYIPLHPEADFTDMERQKLSWWAQQQAEKMLGGDEE